MPQSLVFLNARSCRNAALVVAQECAKPVRAHAEGGGAWIVCQAATAVAQISRFQEAKARRAVRLGMPLCQFLLLVLPRLNLCRLLLLRLRPLPHCLRHVCQLLRSVGRQ